MNRTEKLLSCIDRSMCLLEIGPCHSPIAPKREGWNSYSVDWTNEAELRQKYVSSPAEADKVEHVDFIWRAGPMHESVRAEMYGKFDACIGSHVIEHIPNPIGFFRSLETLLTPDGVVALAIPDKRYCFDFFRGLTMTPAWLEASERNATRHSRRSVLESVVYFCHNREQSAWGQEWLPMSLRLTHELAKNDASVGEDAQSDYIDCHAWCFTPSSFELLTLELGMLNMIEFHIDRLFPATGCEFIVVMRRGKRLAADANARRLDLLRAMIAEQGQQADRMLSKWPAALTSAPYRSAVRRVCSALTGQ